MRGKPPPSLQPLLRGPATLPIPAKGSVSISRGCFHPQKISVVPSPQCPRNPVEVAFLHARAFSSVAGGCPPCGGGCPSCGGGCPHYAGGCPSWKGGCPRRLAGAVSVYIRAFFSANRPRPSSFYPSSRPKPPSFTAIPPPTNEKPPLLPPAALPSGQTFPAAVSGRRCRVVPEGLSLDAGVEGPFLGEGSLSPDN
jgi:hypothetical protein